MNERESSKFSHRRRIEVEKLKYLDTSVHFLRYFLRGSSHKILIIINDFSNT